MNEEMIRQIVETVLCELHRQTPAGTPCKEGMDRMLVIGNPADVPCNLAQEYETVSIEDYIQHKSLRRYQKILIAGLTLTQLADIAQGRDGSPEACAVIHGLLSGMDVCMTETALPHRKYAGKSSSRLYEVIEGHARMLQSFGIRLLKAGCAAQNPAPVKPPKYQAPPVEVPAGSACRNGDKLITEEIARKLLEDGQKCVCLAKDAIVTPSAWDVFRRNGVEVKR